MKSILSALLFLVSISSFGQLDIKSFYDSAYTLGLKDREQGITFLNDQQSRFIEEQKNSLFSYYLARLYASLRYPMDTVTAYYEKAHKKLETSGQDSLAFESLYSLAINWRTAGYYKKAKTYFERARQFAVGRNLPILEGDALNSIGITHYRNYEHAEALTYYLKAKQVFLDNNLSEKIGKTYNNIGIIYKNFNNYEKAIEYYQKAIDIRKENNLPAKFNPYYNLNNLYHSKNNPKKAITYTKAAYIEASEQQNVYFQEDVLASLFSDYLTLKYYDSARVTLQKHLAISEQTVYDTAIYLEKLGRYFIEIEKLDSAEQVLNQAINIYQQEDDLYNTIETKVLLAQAKSEKKQYDDAIKLLKETIQVSKQNELYHWHDESLDRLQQTYSDARMYELAYKELIKLKEREDSIFNESNASIVGGIEASFDLLNQEKKNAVLEKEAKNKELKIRNQRVTIILITTTAFGILIIGFQSLRQQKVKKKLAESEKELIEIELRHKNRELVNFAMQITQKNELIESLNEKIAEVKNGEFKEIEEILKINQSITKDREEFENHVQNVYEGFYTRLELKYSDLTSNDKKLAALIRMDLSSKEMATIMNISPKSVDQGRYRLRQKMELDTKANLSEVLQSI